MGQALHGRVVNSAPQVVRPCAPAAVPAGGNVLKLDEGLCGDVQLVDDRVDDIGIVLRLHLHIIAVTVGDGEK